MSQISQLENLVQIASAASTIAAAANAELTARGAADLVPLGSPGTLSGLRSRSVTGREFALEEGEGEGEGEGGEAQDTVSGLASEHQTQTQQGILDTPNPLAAL